MKKKWYNVRTTQSVLYEQEILARDCDDACETAEQQILEGTAEPMDPAYDLDSEITATRAFDRRIDTEADLGVDDHDPRGDAAYLV